LRSCYLHGKNGKNGKKLFLIFFHPKMRLSRKRSKKMTFENDMGVPARTPTPDGTSDATIYENCTPDQGPASIARLLAGEPLNEAEIAALPETWASLANQIRGRDLSSSAIEAFWALTEGRPDSLSIRTAVQTANIDCLHISDEGEISTWFQPCEVPPLPLTGRDALFLSKPEGISGTWLDRYIAFGLEASPKSPYSFHQIMGLSLLAAVLARRVYLPVSSFNLYPNLYSLIIAPSTLYAKSSTLDLGNGVLYAANLERLLLPVGVTPQSLVTELTNRQPETLSTWDPMDQKSWHDERQFSGQRLWLMDEVGGLLDAFDRKITAELLPYVLKLYDCPPRLSASTISRGRQTIFGGYLTICGPTTPIAMRQHLRNEAHWGNGLFSRFAFITPDSPPVCAFYPRAVVKCPSDIVDHLSGLCFKHLPMPCDGIAGTPLVATLADGVWERWESYHTALWKMLNGHKVSEKLFASYGRLHTMAMKVALLLAVSTWSENGGSGPIVVTAEHWNRAQTIAENFRAGLHQAFADAGRANPGSTLEEKILERISSSTSGISAREIANAVNMTERGNRDYLDQVLLRLEHDGLIVRGERKGLTGPVARVWLMSSRVSPQKPEVHKSK